MAPRHPEARTVAALPPPSTRPWLSRTILTALLLAVPFTFTAAAAPVDLFVNATRPAIEPGDATTVTITVGNDGASSTTPVRLIYATPPYVNIDRDPTRPLPAGCAFLYLNPDRTVPEIVQCLMPPLSTGEQRPVSISVVAHPLAPAGPVSGMASVLPFDRTVDTDDDLLNNRLSPSVVVGRSRADTDGPTNLYLTGDYPAIGGPTPAAQTFVVGNNGPAITVAPVTFTYATPFLVNVDRRRPLPAGCALIFQNPDPGVPEIVQCRIPAGLGPANPQRISIPLSLVPSAPAGNVAGVSAIRVDDASGDRDPDRNDNTLLPFVLILAPLPPPSAADRINRPHVAESSEPGAIDQTPTESDTPSTARPRLEAPLPSGLAPGARIDLSLGANQPAIRPGGTGVQQFTIGNDGMDASGPVRLVYVLPIFINIDRNQPLPADCDFLSDNPDFTVSDIVQCVVPALRQGETVSLPFPLVASPAAPPARRVWIAIVMPAAGSRDVEQFIRNNSTFGSILVLRGGEPPSGGDNLVDLYVATVFPNILTNRPATEILTVGNKGPNPTQGATRVTFTTPFFVNIDRERPLPAGCRFLYENLDPAVPENLECLIDTSIAPGTEVSLAIPVRVAAGGPSGPARSTAIVRPQTGSPDRELNLVDNGNTHGVVVSQLPTHTLRFFLHGRDIPGTAAGFTMNQTPAPPTSTVLLPGGANWFSDPPLLGTFDDDATFDAVLPCTLGLTVAGTYTLAATDLNGGTPRTIGQARQLLSLCLFGVQRVRIPVLTPTSVENERLKLTISAVLGVNLQLGSSTYLETTRFRGTP